MRTTISLDKDVAASLRTIADERGLSLAEALNAVLRQGLTATASARPYRVPVSDLGLRAGVDLDKALALAAQDERGAHP